MAQLTIILAAMMTIFFFTFPYGLVALFRFLVPTSPVDALNPCSAGKMWDNYQEMKRANCTNCDKYFHCQGNYEAVYRCTGFFRRSTAVIISNLREWYQRAEAAITNIPEWYRTGDYGSGAADSAEDMTANRYGLEGGDCSSRYLRNVRCAYDPQTKRCGNE